MHIKPRTQNPMTVRIRELMDGHTDRKEEEEIIGLLRDAESPDLNDTLQDLDLSDLFNDVDDHWFGPKNKTSLLNLLSKERLNDLEVPSKAAVLDGLAKGWTSFATESEEPQSAGIEEQSIRNVFTGTSGEELTDLKNEVNAGADHYDMYNLLFHDLDSTVLRQEILEHIKAEAPAERPQTLKPMSDIDDTFYSSLKDERYPAKTVYPGVLAFYDELDKGSKENQPDELGDLTFLTARPGEFTGIVKDKTHQSLRERGVKEAAVLVGSLTGLINHEEMAAKKFENFENYAAMYPEYSFSWVGDSGQGDAILGQKMMAEHPDKVKGAFIHDVIGLSDEERAEQREKGVRVFDTYLGAAVEAYDLGLLSKEGLERVSEATQQDLAAIDNWDSEEQKQAREEALAADVARMNERLAS